MGCALALLACTLAGCDDRLEVRQAYDFSLSSWYLQEGIEPDETVEIRLTLNREGDYREARYRIGYIQLEGDGEVFAADGTRLVSVYRVTSPVKDKLETLYKLLCTLGNESTLVFCHHKAAGV